MDQICCRNMLFPINIRGFQLIWLEPLSTCTYDHVLFLYHPAKLTNFSDFSRFRLHISIRVHEGLLMVKMASAGIQNRMYGFVARMRWGTEIARRVEQMKSGTGFPKSRPLMAEAPMRSPV